MAGLDRRRRRKIECARDVVVGGRARGQIGRVIASVNPLIPKPGTAYQWLPMTDAPTIDRKIKRLRSLVADIDNVYFNIKSERHSYYQALLSLGDLASTELYLPVENTFVPAGPLTLARTDLSGLNAAEARALFADKGEPAGADGFEVWDGKRFVYRFPEDPPGLE